MHKLSSTFLAILLSALSCFAQDSVWATKKSGWQLINGEALGIVSTGRGLQGPSPSREERTHVVDRGLLGAYGQDDRLSSYCAARAIIDLKGTPRSTALAYLSNFEEVGSVNNTGAGSQFLNSTLARLIGAQRGAAYKDLDLRTALRNSQVISAGTNDGINPIFPETGEESNVARLGYGVTIKRYGRGFDANSEFTARIRAILDQNGIPWQTQTPKVDVGD